MKKLIAGLLIIFTLFALASCGSSHAKFIRTNFGYDKEPVMVLKSVKDINAYNLHIKNAYLTTMIL